MGELRLLLILVGVALVAAVWWWGTRGERQAARRARAEPTMADGEPAEAAGSDQTTPGLAASRAAPRADEAPRDASPARAEPVLAVDPDRDPLDGFDPARQMLLTLYLVPGAGAQLLGADVFTTLDGVGLVHGARRIYHRLAPDGRPVFSVAHLAEPGELDPVAQRFEYLQGLALFAVLPGPKPGTDAFADLLATARRIAQRLHADLTDAERSTLSPQTIQHLREQVLEFERRRGQAGD
jgi:cell division protein ZipA